MAMKKIIVKGLLLGFAAGLIATFFDSLFMLMPNMYVPAGYPVLTAVFNCLFWLLAGGLSGFLLALTVRKKDNWRQREQQYWMVFFLAPFALLYGLFGWLCVESVRRFSDPDIRIDSHLSLLWVFIFLAWLFFYQNRIKKTDSPHSMPVSFFLVDIFILVLLFLGGTYLRKLVWELFINISHDYAPYAYHPRSGLFKLLFSAAAIVSVFMVALLCRLSITLKRSSWKASYILPSMAALVCAVLAACFLFSQQRYARTFASAAAHVEPPAGNSKPNVILLVLDAVRADDIAAYCDSGLLQGLQAFSQEALVYERCVSPSTWTMPAHASLFTGLQVREHGCHDILTGQKTWDGFLEFRSLSKNFTTLAEQLTWHGYLSACVAANSVALHPQFNLNQGFAFYDYADGVGKIYQSLPFRPVFTTFCYMASVWPKYTLYYRTAEDVNEAIFHFFEQAPFQPFFLFVNYMDAHDPYRPPRPFSRYFTNAWFPQLYGLYQKVLRVLGLAKHQDWLTFERSQYDGGIAYLDSQLSNLFVKLKEKGLYDSSLIIITADHGELFGEHGYKRHRVPLYEGVVRVPLMIKLPFSERTGREERMITLTDLYPTIFSLCGLPIPGGISGRAFGEGNDPVVGEFMSFKTGEHRAIYDGNYKYMKYEKSKPAELYDLGKDPQETINITAKMPEVALRMDKKLQEWVQQHPPKYQASSGKKETLSPEVLRGLKALGYVQ